MAKSGVQEIAVAYFHPCARCVIIGPEEIICFIYGGVCCQSNVKQNQPVWHFLPRDGLLGTSAFKERHYRRLLIGYFALAVKWHILLRVYANYVA